MRVVVPVVVVGEDRVHRRGVGTVSQRSTSGRGTPPVTTRTKPGSVPVPVPVPVPVSRSVLLHRAVTSVPVRPCGLSDTRRNPVSCRSAAAGTSNARTTSPGASVVVRGPVTSSATGTRRSPPSVVHTTAVASSVTSSAVTAPAGSAVATFPPTVAAFHTLKDASRAFTQRSTSGQARQSGSGVSRSSAASVHVAPSRSPSGVRSASGQPRPVRSTRPVVSGCSSEYSQVPPARGCSPGASARSSRCDGVRTVRTETRSMRGSDRVTVDGSGVAAGRRPCAIMPRFHAPRADRDAARGADVRATGPPRVGSVRGGNAREPVFQRRYGPATPGSRPVPEPVT